MPCHELVKGYNSDPGMDHMTAVKIVLGVNKDMFLIYGSDKKFVVKSYVDANFDTDPDGSKSQSGYILKVEQLARVALCRAL